MPNNSLITKILEAMKDAGLVVAAEVKTVAVDEFHTLRDTVETMKTEIEELKKQQHQ